MIACSTGSPASRKDTKFTPFTTRPSLTSRQGMTRTLSISSPRIGERSDGEKRPATRRFARHRGGLYQRFGLVQMGQRFLQSRRRPARGLGTEGLLAREMNRRPELLHRQRGILALI